MEINADQFDQFESYLPRQCGNVSHVNLDVLNAILFVAKNGCKWCALPSASVTGLARLGRADALRLEQARQKAMT